MRFSVWNARSVNKKVYGIMEHIMDNESDIVFFTETWLKSDKCKATSDFKDFGYSLLHAIRTGSVKSRGGGVGVLVKTNITSRIVPAKEYTSFEYIILKIKLNISSGPNQYLYLLCVYRLQEVSAKMFFDEFSDFLSTNITSIKQFIIAGDFNFHMDCDDSTTVQFNQILDLFSLKQHVTGATHIGGHTLDLIITLKDLQINVDKFESALSDHFLLNSCYPLSLPRTYTTTINYRPLHKIDSIKFEEDVRSLLFQPPIDINFQTAVEWYNNSMSSIVNKIAPIKVKQIKVKPNAPWFDSEYKLLRRKRRAAERKFRKSRLDVHKEELVCLRKLTTSTAEEKKKQHFSNKLENCTPKIFFETTNLLLDNQNDSVLPSGSDLHVANSFMEFFNIKITKIRNSFVSAVQTNDGHFTTNRSDTVTIEMHIFRPATLDEIKSIVSTFPIKCSPEDPIPTKLLKKHSDLFLNFWLQIVNISLATGSIDGIKSAIVTPLLKEISSKVDTEEFKNYRPVSNIVFLSKVIERVVATRLDEHMLSNNLYNNNQFGYRKFHSTETLLLKVLNDLLLACDQNSPSILILLDLSAAFDTVDHNKMLYILKNDIGIGGIALEWFRSFLIGRTCRVKINNVFSDASDLLYGVPQGSVLGPLLFSIYIRGLYSLIDSVKFSIDGFADDNQLVKTFLLQLQLESLSEGVVQCINKISEWMQEHFLCLNPDKTKIIIVAPPDLQKEILIRGVIYKSNCIRFVNSAKNLGVLLDGTLSLDKQIQNLIKYCYTVIRKLSQIKSFLTQDQLKTMVSTYILQKLDYCNALYFGLSSSSIQSLQRVQNSALRLAHKGTIPLFSSLSPFYLKLHWLKIEERIVFKLILMVHKCLRNRGPGALRELLIFSDSARTMALIETRVNTKYGKRAFSHAGPKVWNKLPSSIKEEENTEVFKKKLKSFLLLEGTITLM